MSEHIDSLTKRLSEDTFGYVEPQGGGWPFSVER